jgi:hypothetical protein
MYSSQTPPVVDLNLVGEGSVPVEGVGPLLPHRVHQGVERVNSAVRQAGLCAGHKR